MSNIKKKYENVDLNNLFNRKRGHYPVKEHSGAIT